MKKQLLLIAWITLIQCSILQGQYFSCHFMIPWTGNPTVRFETFYDGMYTRLNYGGGNPLNHYLVGLGTSNFLTAITCPRPDSVITYLRFVRTIKSGNVISANTAMAFREKNDTSILYNAAGNSFAEILTTNNNGGYATVGGVVSFECDSIDRTDGLFLKINNAGIASDIFRYDFNGGADVFTKIIRSQVFAKTYYICGHTTVAGTNIIRAIILSVNNKGAVNWSRTIDLAGTTAIGTESKLFSITEDISNGNLLAVGTYLDPAVLSPNTQGLALSISSAGAINWVKSYNLLHDEFRNVVYDNNAFIISGTSDINPAPLGFNFNDVWLLKLDTMGNVIFSNKLRTNDNNGNSFQSRGVDVTVRTTAAGNKEIYVAGPTYSNPTKAMVYKCTGAGAGLSWYDYHTTFYDYGFAIDKSDESATTSKGLALFSNTTAAPANIGAPHSHLKRIYFNGVACPEFCISNAPTTIMVNPNITVLTPTVLTQVSKRPLVAHYVNPAHWLICGPNNILCGSNTKVAIDETAQGISAYPNPANGFVNVTGADSDVSIADITGKVVMQIPFTETGTTININSLKSGFYFISCGTHHTIFVKQ